MATETTTNASITETGKSIFAVEIQVSGHDLTGDEPESSGGKNLGPAPYDLLTGALGECTAMTVRWYAQQKSWPVEHVAVTVTHRKADAATAPEVEGRTGIVDLFDKTVMIKGDKLTPEQRQRLLDVAAKCPVHKTLQSMPVITTHAG